MAAADHLNLHGRSPRSVGSTADFVASALARAASFGTACSLGSTRRATTASTRNAKLATVRYATLRPCLAGLYSQVNPAATINQTSSRPDVHTIGSVQGNRSICNRLLIKFSTVPERNPTASIATEIMMDQKFNRSRHSRLGSRTPGLGVSVCFR